MSVYKIPSINEIKEQLKVKMKREIKIKRMWGNINYKKYSKFLLKRINLLNQLYLIYPEIELQGEGINGERSKLFSFDTFDARIYYPSVHYRVLPNEIVFDFDVIEKEEINKLLKELIRRGIKPICGLSGNRGIHIHVLVAPPKGDICEFAVHPLCKEFTFNLFEYLLNVSGIEEDLVDKSVMKSVHTIRSFYSLNTKGMKWKLPFYEYSKDYPIWKLSKNLFKEIRDRMIENKEIEELIKELEYVEIEKKKINKILRVPWIEKILKNPEKITDCRRRLILYVLPQYLIFVKGMNAKEAAEYLMKWVYRTPRKDDNYLKYLIKSQIKSCERKPEVMKSVLMKYINYERFKSEVCKLELIE